MDYAPILVVVAILLIIAAWVYFVPHRNSRKESREQERIHRERVQSATDDLQYIRDYYVYRDEDGNRVDPCIAFYYKFEPKPEENKEPDYEEHYKKRTTIH